VPLSTGKRQENMKNGRRKGWGRVRRGHTLTISVADIVVKRRMKEDKPAIELLALKK
jgi:hypothetical protein